ncbi:MAG: glutathione S-transferase family protein [Acidocella sp.]|nr:glutathione S-transferase family protein [Acidocella sp.]
MQLILGTRRYSSWSMRGWLAAKMASMEFDEVVIPIADGITEAIKPLSPSGLVPALVTEGQVIWDSLAIAEYCAELSPELWPQNRLERAVARSIAAEMHAGFPALRRALPMNLGRMALKRELSTEVNADISRIERIWGDSLTKSAGPYLFGASPTIPDIMFAPVVSRFLTYDVTLNSISTAYCGSIRAWDLVALWYELAAKEPASWHLAKYE